MFSHLGQLNNIRTFEAAARLGSFKEAGKELNISSTAISHQIANLEIKLGTLLFERKTRAIALTVEGTKLFHSAHQALQQLSSTFEEISNAQSTLRITTTTAFASMWLVPNLTKFQIKHPEIHIEIHTSENTEDLIKDRRIDLAIRYGCGDSTNNAIKLMTENFSLYATPNYLKTNKNMTKSRLIETRWKNQQLPTMSCHDWLQKYEPKEVTPDIQFFDQENHVIQAALAGQGIALASSVLVQMAVNQGWLKPYKDDCILPGLAYYLLTSPFNKNLRKVSAFKEWLIEELS